jgi:hypothetical protein
MSRCATRFGCVAAVRWCAAPARLAALRRSTWTLITLRGWIWAGGLLGLQFRRGGWDGRRAFYFAKRFGGVAAAQ